MHGRRHRWLVAEVGTAALAELAGQLPPAVLADLLGLHPSTATAWARRIASDWAAYIDTRNRSKGDS